MGNQAIYSKSLTPQVALLVATQSELANKIAASYNVVAKRHEAFPKNNLVSSSTAILWSAAKRHEESPEGIAGSFSTAQPSST